MIKEKRKPSTRFPGFEDDWEQRKLGDLVNSSSGFTGDANLNDGKYRLTRIETIANGTVNEERVGYTNEQPPESYLLESGDILYSNINSIDHIGKVALYHRNEQPLYHGINLLKLKPNKEIQSDYLFHFLNSRIARNWAEVHANKAVSQASINQSSLSKQLIAYCSIEEQERISTLFNKIDETITLHQRKLDDLKELKSGLLQKMFPQKGEKVPQVRFPGFTGDWEQRKLGDLGTTYGGLSGKSKEDFGHGEASFITYLNVFNNPVTNPELVEKVEIDPKQNKVEVGDVFFTTSSETPEEVGMSSVLTEECEETYLNSFCFGFRPTYKFDLSFLAFMLRSEAVREKIKILAQGISRYNISKKKVMEIEVPVPELEEQKAIGSFFNTLEEAITLHQKKIDDLNQLKSGLLQKMFP